MLIKIIVIVSLFNSLNSEELSLSLNKTLTKNWLGSCTNTKCTLAINQCISTSCSGYPSCRICIANKDPLCYQCSSDIFNTNYMMTLYGNRYLPCDQNDAFQNQVCKIYCRDSFSKTLAECKPIETFSACFCYSAFNGNIYTTLVHSYSVKALATRSGSNEFAVGLSNGDVRLLYNNGGSIRNFTIQSGSSVNGLAYFSNGDIAVTGNFGTRLYSNSGTLLKTFTTSSGLAIVVLKNGDVAFTSGSSIYIWTPSSSTYKYVLNGHFHTIYSLVVLPNGYLASGSADYSIRIWEPVGGSVVKILNGHTNYVRSLIVLENGDLASGSDDRQIRIWSVNLGFTIKTITTDHSNYISALSLLPNGRIASGSRDYNIKIWNKETGLIEKTLSNGHTNTVNQIAANNNNYLVSVSDDGSVKLWS